MTIFAAGSAAAAVIGAELASSAAGYYADLDTSGQLPAWALPRWLLGAIWLVVYAGIALAAWLVWRQGGIRRRWREIGLYSLQLALNVGWWAAVFWLQQPTAATVLIVALDVVTLATVVAFARRSHLAAWLFGGYLVWLVYLTSLTAGLL